MASCWRWEMGVLLMITFTDKLEADMKWLAEQEDTVFLGQGITVGDKFYGTLDEVPKHKCIEFPVAENLMMGSAVGLALQGYKPIVLFQRMDFMLIAADQIINHLALMPEMSGNQFELPVVIRACVGSQSKRFDVGKQHNKNFKHIFQPYLEVVDYTPGIYRQNRTKPLMVIEYKDSYGEVYNG